MGPRSQPPDLHLPTVNWTEPLTASDKALTFTERLAVVVRDRGYIRRDVPFQLSSGGTSHDYVDMRRALSKGSDLLTGAKALIETLNGNEISFDAIGGMTMGADPISHAIAMQLGCSWFSVRKATKDHGAKRRVEGAELSQGTQVVVVEDTVSTGRSVLEALDVVTATGANVVAVATLLDRGDHVAPLVEARGLRYLAVISYKDIGIEPLLGPSEQGPETA